jgi:hypothetical protein
MKTLAEDLVLLALDDVVGSVSWPASIALKFGLGGALLMDLALQDRIDCLGEAVVVVDPTPTGDAVLDAALNTIRISAKPEGAKDWVKRLGGRSGLTDRLARRLVSRGILREQDRAFLWVFRRHGFPTEDIGPETLLRGQIREVALGTVEPDPRTIMLLSLIDACKLVDDLFSEEERTQVRRRIADLVVGEPFGNAVAAAIAAAAATTAAVSAAAFSTTVAPGASG